MDDWTLSMQCLNGNHYSGNAIKEFIRRFNDKCVIMDKNGLGNFMAFNECELDELLGDRFALEKEGEQ